MVLPHNYTPTTWPQPQDYSKFDARYTPKAMGSMIGNPLISSTPLLSAEERLLGTLQRSENMTAGSLLLT